MDLPAGTTIIGFTDDALVVCAAEDVRILELRITVSRWWAKRWLDSRGLKMVPENTEALLVVDRRSFQYPKIVLGEHEVQWKTSISLIEGSTLANTFRSQLPRPSNVEQSWLALGPTLLDPGK